MHILYQETVNCCKTHKKIKICGFTLVELLIAFAILSLLVILLSSLVRGVNRAWVSSEQQVSEFQDGRAITELISRELSQAVISPSLQFVTNPTLLDQNSQPLDRTNSDSIFWQAPASSTASGNLSEIGYYLTSDYNLRRFYVPPSDSTNYQVFYSPNQPADTAAPWVTNFVRNSALSTTVSSGVLAFWVRCFDANGDLIPWLSNNVGATPLRFNSNAHFQPAIRGQPLSFKYTNPTTTAKANLLPSVVELTVIMLDPQSFRRNPQIPPLPSVLAPANVPTVRDSYSQQLISNNIKTARTFTARVNLVNSGQ